MKKLLAFSLLALAATSVNAEAAWLQYSIASPGDLLLPWNRPDVYGLRLDMPYARNKGSVYGLDIGFVGVADGDMCGLALTFANIVDLGATDGFQLGVVANRTKVVCGAQISGILNWNEDVAYALQMAPVNVNGEFYGLQIGGINWFGNNGYGASVGGFLMSEGSFTGFSAAALNYGMKRMEGFQLGGINLAAEHSSGLQLALVNVAKYHDGVQLGLVNINGLGFLPCSPGINFNFTR